MNQMISNNFPPNTLHIRYEDLVTNPPASEAISNHVRLPHISDIKPFEKLYSKGLPDFDPQRYNQLSDDPRIVQCYKKMIPTLKKLGYATE